jgi:hypothetical protein
MKRLSASVLALTFVAVPIFAPVRFIVNNLQNPIPELPGCSGMIMEKGWEAELRHNSGLQM